MSHLPEHINNFLWRKDEAYYKENVGRAAPCISFLAMQIIRLILILFMIGVWAINFYINVKKCLMYLNFWALTITLLYMLFVFPTAGRIVVEEKLEERKQLEDKDRTKNWKRAVFLHSIAWPLTVTSTILFTAFLRNDQICSTYFDYGLNEWRGVVVYLATYTPMGVLLIDFAMNKIPLSYRHLLVNLLVLGLYFFIAFIGSTIQDRPIYPNYLAFKSTYSHNFFFPKDENLSQWARVRKQECLDSFDWENPKTLDTIIINGYQGKLWTTIGTAVSCLLVSHVLITFLSQMKALASKKPQTEGLIGNDDSAYKGAQ